MRESTKMRHQKLIDHDSLLWAQGLSFSGMDEAGRGPLAGPVVAACVVMPQTPLVVWVDDSKKLSETRRELVYEDIMQTALFVGVGQVEAEEIDAINILRATRLAMQRAAQGCPAELFLVDAMSGLDLPGDIRAIIKGDATSYSIAAASIVAKVTRDRELRLLDEVHPQYGFSANKGYGTAQHIQALRLHGPCAAHRLTFIGNLLSEQT